MATQLSTFLRLRLTDDLTKEARANLVRLDNLGASFRVDSSGDLTVRSRGDITIQPNDITSGGSGSGGALDVGDAGQELDSITIYSLLTALSGELRLRDDAGGEYIGFKSPDTVISSVTFTLPDGDGSANQVLSTDGSGVLSWSNPSGIDGLSVIWNQGEGTSKAITHNFDTTDLTVFVYDNDSNCEVYLDSITYDDVNNITLGVIQAPGPGGYTVQLQET